MPNNTDKLLMFYILYMCFSVHVEPQILYKLPTRSKQEKIEDTLMCHSPVVSKH